ncbi:MAG TPA: sulfatase-like hydrolase/transferase, partial [Puia sp.]|nr:sulfatase-like hydrolase/transferase [Puia sp.]
MRRPITFFRLFRAIFLGLAFLLILHTLLRAFFVAYNPLHSPHAGNGETIRVYGWGFALDLSAIIVLNIPVFLFFFLSQYSSRSRGLLLRCSRLSFLLLNTAGLAINIIDIGYFRYDLHRSNVDLWYVLRDSASSFGSIIIQYWPLVGLFLVLVTALAWMGRKLFTESPSSMMRLSPGWPALAGMQAILAVLLFAGVRGLGASPLMPMTPLLNIDPARLPQAQNSIGTLFYSLLRRQDSLKRANYFEQSELNKIAGTHFFLGGGRGVADSMQKKNVIICILESFSRCYLTPGDPMKANTPFFDSLIARSIYFPNAHANGYTSNQGIVSILAGLPSFLDEPFFYSEYANTPLRSIGNILKEKGYDTNFFLGAGKDHFGFGKFTHMAGIDHYYSRADFNDDRFYDGNWGIFDEPFLQ